MSGAAGVTRRRFLQVSGGAGLGLVISFHLPGSRLALASAAGVDPSAWVRIRPDGTIRFLVSESEMGQGVFTAVSQLLADELEADWGMVQAEAAPTDASLYGSQGTGGSTSMRQGFDRFRLVGATAREMLITAAAEVWGVDRDDCRAENGEVVHRPTGRRLGYGDVAERAASLEPPENPPLKSAEAFRYIGRPMPRLDTPDKVDGTAEFGLDVRFSDLLTAVVARPPAFGAEARSFSDEAARAIPGVRDVVPIPGGVAVVADGFWAAHKGREALEVEWEGGQPDLDDARILRMSRELANRGSVAREDGRAESALAAAGRRVDAEFELPYLAHAPMEPMNCTAHVRPDGCEIWAPTQAQSSTQRLAARLTGLPVERVTVNTTYLGGGFGRRSGTDFVADAVHVSKALGLPVKVVYTRADDMRAGLYRPVAYHRVSAGLDAAGRPVAWSHDIVSPSIIAGFGAPLENGVDASAVEGIADLQYPVPNIRVTYANLELPISVHWWRSVGNSFNGFVVECMVDELAAAAGADPVEYRLSLLGDHPRRRRALALAAEKAGWGSTLPVGRARGAAVYGSFGSIVAQVAEVSVDDGEVRVHRVTCAVDCGRVVNPDTIEAQMESGIVFGLSAALWGRISIREGGAVESNFHDYRVVRMKESPRIDTHIVAEGDPIGGIGEVGVPPIAPAVANAAFALTGRRIRRLPIGEIG